MCTFYLRNLSQTGNSFLQKRKRLSFLTTLIRIGHELNASFFFSPQRIRTSGRQSRRKWTCNPGMTVQSKFARREPARYTPFAGPQSQRLYRPRASTIYRLGPVLTRRKNRFPSRRFVVVSKSTVIGWLGNFPSRFGIFPINHRGPILKTKSSYLGYDFSVSTRMNLTAYISISCEYHKSIVRHAFCYVFIHIFVFL